MTANSRRRHAMVATVAILAVASLLAGCFKLSAPKLGPLYTRAAMEQSPRRNPVIVIPGILGSKLLDRESDTVVWGAFTGQFANPETGTGARLLGLPMRLAQPLSELQDRVQSDGALDRVKLSLLGLPVSLKAYSQILATLGAGGYRDELLGKSGAIEYGDQHYTCFQFDYDWRRDNAENARRLHRFILEKKKFVQGEIEKRFGLHDYDVKFDIVAHSMGGLVTRYMLRYGEADVGQDGPLPDLTWAGAQHVQRVILVGTPNAGSVDSLLSLINGISFAPVLPRVEPAILGTMPSVYQLLPRARHGAVTTADNNQAITNLYDPALWERMGWGLAAPDQDRVLATLLPGVADAGERRRIAMEHLSKCLNRAARFTAALDEPATPPPSLEMYLFAGDAKPTESVVSVDPESGRVKVVGHAPGDGTVLRSSALMDERLSDSEWSPRLRSPIRWRHAHFLFTDHLGLTADPAFSDNVLYLLLESPR